MKKVASQEGHAQDQRYVPKDIDDAFSGQAPKAPTVATLGFVGTGRFIWRQLTSMRVALMLLMLLAVAAVPGSMFPQRPQDPQRTAQYVLDNPKTGPWLDKLGFFDVYASPWFSAIYILLFISLVGCILPRVGAHLKALRSAPPRVPRRFNRFPAQAQLEVSGQSPEQVIAVANRALRGRLNWLPTFRTAATTEQDRDGRVTAHTLSAERGYLRETGNLVFHISLVGILLSFGAGQMVQYRGQALITEGRGFANVELAYDTFSSGAWFRESTMAPFTVQLDQFVSSFRLTDSKALDFSAHVTVTDTDAAVRQEVIKVNEPLIQDGAKVYLMGNGYAPTVTVRDASGEVAFSGSVPFLPQDDFYTSSGVIKVPDVTTGEQLGFVGFLLPTADFSTGDARSIYPEALDPVLILDLYTGDLGLDTGVPQNVYRLNTEDMTQANESSDLGFRPIAVSLGETVELPGDLGTIEFSAIPRYAAFDLRYDPTLGWLALFAFLALAGVGTSLFTPRRRVWVRATATDSGTRVELAGLARGDDFGLQGEVDRVRDALAHDPSTKRVPVARSREI